MNIISNHQISKKPSARNNKARHSFQRQFEAIFEALKSKVDEFEQMKKYIRVYKESNKLLKIEETIDIIAGNIYEIDFEKQWDVNALQPFIQRLDKTMKVLEAFIQNKPYTLQSIKTLQHISDNITIIINTFQQVNEYITRINDIIPVIKAILQLPDEESNYRNTSVFTAIRHALITNIEIPDLSQIKIALNKEKLLSHYDAKLNFEHINDVSDKLIGLLNDKLLLLGAVSEFLDQGQESGDTHVIATQRLPDELNVLFLISNLFTIFYTIKEIKNCLIILFKVNKHSLKLIKSDQLESPYQSLLTRGNKNVYTLLSNRMPQLLKKIHSTILPLSQEI